MIPFLHAIACTFSVLFFPFLVSSQISIIIMKRAKKWRNCNLCGSDWMINANTILTRFFVSQYSHACACAISLDNLLLISFYYYFCFIFFVHFVFNFVCQSKAKSKLKLKWTQIEFKLCVSFATPEFSSNYRSDGQWE